MKWIKVKPVCAIGFERIRQYDSKTIVFKRFHCIDLHQVERIVAKSGQNGFPISKIDKHRWYELRMPRLWYANKMYEFNKRILRIKSTTIHTILMVLGIFVTVLLYFLDKR